MVTFTHIDVHDYDVYSFMFMLVLVQYFKCVPKTTLLLFSFFILKLLLRFGLGCK